MEEVFTDVYKTTNLEKLRILVDTLEKEDNNSIDYHKLLTEIETIIKDEKSIISNLKNSETKLRHYEIICKTILSLLATVKF